MKRFILIALVLAGCVQFDPAQTFTKEALEMGTVYTPDPTNNPATITLPTAGDPVASSVADQAWKDIADKDARKVDAVGGGTYAPASSIIVGGAGIETIGGSGLRCDDSFLSTCADDLFRVDHRAHFRGGALFDNSGLFTCQVGGSFTAGLDVGGGLHSTAGTILDLTTTLSGSTSLLSYGGRIRSTGVGRIETRTYFGISTDADQDITMSMGVQHIQAVLATTDRTYTMKNAGCVGDETISIFNESAASHQLIIKQDNGSTTIVSLSTTSGDYIGVELWNDGLGNAASSWHVKSATHKA